MATMLENETYLTNFNDTSAPVTDEIASQNSNLVNGTPVFDSGAGLLILDGASASIGWTTAGKSPWKWNDINGTSGYIMFINQMNSATLNGVLKVIHGVEAGQPAGPTITWDDINQVNALTLGLNALLANAGHHFLLGREMKLDEKFIMAWSLNHSTKAWIMVLKSNDSVSPIDLNTSGTMTTIPSEDKDSYCGSNSALTNFSKVNFDQMGSVKGSQFTLSELQADADTLLAPPPPALDPSGVSLFTSNSLFAD